VRDALLQTGNQGSPPGFREEIADLATVPFFRAARGCAAGTAKPEEPARPSPTGCRLSATLHTRRTGNMFFNLLLINCLYAVQSAVT